MWIIEPPSSTTRFASAPYSSGVYGMAGHWSRLATAPEMLLVITTGSSKLMVPRWTVDRGQWTGERSDALELLRLWPGAFGTSMRTRCRTPSLGTCTQRSRTGDRTTDGPLVSKLVRAAGSVRANIAEGTGRWHRKDQRRFLLMARGSMSETEHWISLAQSLGLLSD